MHPVALLTAVVVLVVALVVATVAHELSHAVTLRALGVPCEVDWRPEREGAGFLSAQVALATVTPRHVPRDLSPWRLRVAALMPLTLAAPIPLVLLGVLPDPTASGDPVLVAAAMGWLACSLPSPQDFSLAWHPEAAIEDYAADDAPGDAAGVR